MRIVGRTLVALLLGLGLGLAAPAGAADNPFAPALTINGGVITNYDIQQRMALLSALGATGDLKKLATQQLTEDRVKVQAAKALSIELPDGALDTGLQEFATARNLTVDDVLKVLAGRKIDRQTMDDFVQSGLLWREVMVQKFRARANPSEEDLDQALALRASQPREMAQMAEIAIPFGERGEPETLALGDQLYKQLSRGASFADAARTYSRSNTAPNGGLMEPMPLTQMPPALRSQILLLSPGQITRPMPIAGGIAILKLVSIRNAPPDKAPDPKDQAVRDALRQQLFADRINSFGQGYLQELLNDALIVTK